MRSRARTGSDVKVRSAAIRDLNSILSDDHPLLRSIASGADLGLDVLKISDRGNGSSPTPDYNAGVDAFSVVTGSSTSSDASAAVASSVSDMVAKLGRVLRAVGPVKELSLSILSVPPMWLTELPQLLQGHAIESLTIVVPGLPEAAGEALSEIVAPPQNALRTLRVRTLDVPLSTNEVAAFAEGLRSNSSLTQLSVVNVNPPEAGTASQTLLECAQASICRKVALQISVNETESGSDGIVVAALPPSQQGAGAAGGAGPAAAGGRPRVPSASGAVPVVSFGQPGHSSMPHRRSPGGSEHGGAGAAAHKVSFAGVGAGGAGMAPPESSYGVVSSMGMQPQGYAYAGSAGGVQGLPGASGAGAGSAPRPSAGQPGAAMMARQFTGPDGDSGVEPA
jgi:hypothetical protein